MFHFHIVDQSSVDLSRRFFSFQDALVHFNDKANTNTVRTLCVIDTDIGFDNLVELLDALVHTQIQSLYALEFREAGILDEHLRIIFDSVQNFPILRNIMVSDNQIDAYSEETITYCQNSILKYGPFCVAIYTSENVYNLDYLGQQWARANGSTIRSLSNQAFAEVN